MPGNALVQGWRVRQFGQALVTRGGEDADVAAAGLRQEIRRVAEIRLHMPGQQILQRRRAAFVGNVGQLQPDTPEKQFSHQVGGGAGAAGGEVHRLRRAPLRPFDELLQGASRHGTMDPKHQRVGAHVRYRDELLQRLESQLGGLGQDDHRGGRYVEQHGAVSRRAHELARRQEVAAAGRRVDDDRAVQFHRQARRQEPRHGVRTPACGERDHDAQRPCLLRPQGRHRQSSCQRAEAGDQSSSRMHGHPHAKGFNETAAGGIDPPIQGKRSTDQASPQR